MDTSKVKLIAIIMVPVLIVASFIVLAIFGVATGVSNSFRQSNADTCDTSVTIDSPAALDSYLKDGGCGGGACAVTTSTSGSGSADASGLTPAQVKVLEDIIGTGKAMNISQQGQVVAVITALTESGLQNYANDGVYNPAKNPSDANYSATPSLFTFAKLSLSYPHDAVGSDASSVGPFQQQAWWGGIGTSNWQTDPNATMARLMDPVFQSQKFYNSLTSISGWESLPPGEAAQKVQVSATPDAYAPQVSRATALVQAYADKSSATTLYNLDKPAITKAGDTGGTTSLCGTGTGGLPLPKTDWYHITAQWDQPRSYEHHPGMDIGCSPGHPAVYSMTSGTVVISIAGNSSGTGTPMGQITILLPDGSTMTYLHGNSALVTVGQTVAVGTPITNCASTGLSTGDHVHLQVDVTNSTSAIAKALPTGVDLAPGLRDPALFMYEVYNTNICPPYVADRLKVTSGSPLPNGGGYLACWP